MGTRLTTTASNAVDKQGTDGNWAKVCRITRGGKCIKRQGEKRKVKNVSLKVVTLNVGVKERNLEGQLGAGNFAERRDIAVLNTYFQKREEHRVTYKSRCRNTQVDYILCSHCNHKQIGDCRALERV